MVRAEEACESVAVRRRVDKVSLRGEGLWMR
jgi:hypothetical protein